MTSERPPPLSAYYSTYSTANRKRVHIAAPAHAFPRRRPPDGLAFCSLLTPVHATIVPPPYVLPSPLAWCPACIGLAAEVLGAMDYAARPVLVALDDARSAQEAAARD